MATAEVNVNIFDCPICLEKLKIPKYLYCLHTFCLQCIEAFIVSSTTGKSSGMKSFECPVCRLEVVAPSKNISAKEWAKNLPANHLIVSLMDSAKENTNIKSEKSVAHCDPCRRANETKVAKYRCKECRDCLCEMCYTYIHKRVREFDSHTVTDVSDFHDDEPVEIAEPCLIHRKKCLEVYCFDHKVLCCSICFATKHRKCDDVKSLDEIVEELGTSFQVKTSIAAINNMKAKTFDGITATKANIDELEESKVEILEKLSSAIEHSKRKLDMIHNNLKKQLEKVHVEEMHSLDLAQGHLSGFLTTLKESEKILKAIDSRGTKRQLFLSNEKIKMQVSDHLDRLQNQVGSHQQIELGCKLDPQFEDFNNVKKLGSLKVRKWKVDFISGMREQLDLMKEEPVFQHAPPSLHQTVSELADDSSSNKFEVLASVTENEPPSHTMQQFSSSIDVFAYDGEKKKRKGKRK